MRAATATDAAVIHDITQRSFSEFRGSLDPPNGSDIETPAQIADQLSRGYALIGYIDNTPVASVRLQATPEHLYVGRFGVIPEKRGRGIGAAIMQSIEDIARTMSTPRVQLSTRAKLQSNVRFYNRLGYVIIRTAPHPGGSDIIVTFNKRIEPGSESGTS